MFDGIWNKVRERFPEEGISSNMLAMMMLRFMMLRMKQ